MFATRSSGASRHFLYLVYQCLCGRQFRKNPPNVHFTKGTSYTNPFDLLSVCYKLKQPINTEADYKTTTEIELKESPSLQEIFEVTWSDREKLCFPAPLSCVENEYTRNFVSMVTASVDVMSR